MEEPLCRRCLAKGETTPSEEVHHVVPIAVDPGRRLDRSNLEALCRTHHSQQTALDSGFAGGAREDSWV